MLSFLQAESTSMDSVSAAGDMSTVLCPCGHANLCGQHGGAIRLVQEGVGRGTGQLLLGILLHSGSWRICQWQVSQIKKGGVHPHVTIQTRFSCIRNVCGSEDRLKLSLVAPKTDWCQLILWFRCIPRLTWHNLLTRFAFSFKTACCFNFAYRTDKEVVQLVTSFWALHIMGA